MTITNKINNFLKNDKKILLEKNEDVKYIFKKCIIYGTFHPQLNISGFLKNKNIKILIYANNKKIFSNSGNSYRNDIDHIFNTKDDFNNTFDYMIKLPITSSKVIVEIREKNNILCKYRLNNNFFKKIVIKILKILKLIYKAIKILWKKYHFIVPFKMYPYYFRKLKEKLQMADSNMQFLDPFNCEEYNEWLIENEKYEKVEKLEFNPLISLIVPVYNVPTIYLEECIQSVLNQTYENWELCLIDDCSTDKNIRPLLEKYSKIDKRIVSIYREKNGRISEATNTGFNKANGEYIGLLDNDDTLSKDALYEMAKAINDGADFIYSDEDKINVDEKRCDPYFKTDWAPDTLMSNNYICHFTVFKKELLDSIGGNERKIYDGAQDFDLFLRLTEKANKIFHIKRILYHWRIIPGSTSENISAKQYAVKAGQMAIEDALKRRKLKGTVLSNGDGTYIVQYDIKKEPLISIIIPTRDYASTLKTCIDSIYEKSTYKNYEIIVIDNGSKEKSTFELFDNYRILHDNFKVLKLDCEFNYSYINNEAVKKASGEYILLLNNDTSIISSDFLEQMVMYASLEHVGAVGAKLYYPDNTIQHAGIVLGIRGMAGHAYVNYRDDYPLHFGKLKMPCNYAGVTAACLMVSKKKYMQVGGLEEKLKVNFNDVEFNIKLLDAGYYNVFLPQVKLYHYESKSRGVDLLKEQLARTTYERNYVIDKWSNIIFNDPFYNPNYSKNDIYKLERQ